jgi:hypothetical protein
MAALLPVPSELTSSFDIYISHILPARHAGPIWLKQDGGPRTKFSPVTREVSRALLDV